MKSLKEQSVRDEVVDLYEKSFRPLAQRANMDRASIGAELAAIAKEHDATAEINLRGDRDGGSRDRLTIKFVTDPITLACDRTGARENLGRFEVTIELDNYYEELNKRVYADALDPNPCSHRSNITHPHVNDTDICLGDESHQFYNALEQGRFADAVDYVNSVLHNYNDDSPFVQLSDWHGVRCGNCDSAEDSGDPYECSDCGEDVCRSCGVTCYQCNYVGHEGCNELQTCAACDRFMCDEHRNFVGHDYYCNYDAAECEGCSDCFRTDDLEEGFCKSCRTETCDKCGGEFDPDDLADGVCEDCQLEECDECGGEFEPEDLVGGKCEECNVSEAEEDETEAVIDNTV